MPTVSVSSRVSDAVYFAAIIGLSVLLARPVYLAYSASQQRAAETVASGFGSMLDSMSPGVSLIAGLASYPGVGYSVTLSGHVVVASFGSASASAYVHWALPHATLEPGRLYNLTLEGGTVVIRGASSD